MNRDIEAINGDVSSSSQNLVAPETNKWNSCCLRSYNWYFITYFLGYLVFLGAAALIFSYLERSVEMEANTSLHSAIHEFIAEHSCVLESDLEDFVRELLDKDNAQLSLQNSTDQPDWSFGQSLFFVASVVTTIGYGRITPVTTGGKVFCLIFASIGIPLTLILASAFLERLMIPVNLLLKALQAKLENSSPLFIKVLHLSLVGVLVCCLFFLIPAGILYYLEPGWNYLDALYYCFISLTTIGLGDYIPGDAPNQPYRLLYKICITAYLFLGITFMMMILAVFSGIPQLNLSVYCQLQDGEKNQNNHAIKTREGEEEDKHNEQHSTSASTEASLQEQDVS